MPKGRYINDSSWYIGIMPNGEKRYFCTEGEYLEAYYEELEDADQAAT